MNVKEKLLFLLEEGVPLSGEKLAEGLGVSRQAIWKAINELKADGYKVEAVTGKGYLLTQTGDYLSAETVKRLLLDNLSQNIDIYVYDILDSTNNRAKAMAAEGGSRDALIIAKEQSAGRGRRGHSFYSPKDGLYMSLVIRPEPSFTDTALYTICAANSVAGAVEYLCGERAMVKWVNDIFVKGKKICGILTEATTDMESKDIQSIVMGIGVNVGKEEVPPDLKDIVGTLDGKTSRAKMAAEITARLYQWLESDREEIIREYKTRSLVLGKTVSFTRNGMVYSGTGEDIDKDGELIVKLPDGDRIALNSGEISVKIDNQ